ncbi:MAG: tyrosine-type recombinase/integrase [Dongiaceae bacterium]
MSKDFSRDAAKLMVDGDVLWDKGAGAVRGLHLAQRSGRQTWYIYFRDANGTQRKPKVGDFLLLNLSEARSRAGEILKAPVATAPSSKPTIRDLTKKYIEDKRNVPAGKRRKKESSLAEDERIFNKQILPAFGDREAESITQAEFTEWHNSKSATPYEANRVLGQLKHLYNLGVKKGWLPLMANPAAGVQRYTEKLRHRPATPEELRRIFAAIAHYERKHPRQCLAFRLLIATGARCGEILGAKMGDIKRQPDGSGRLVLQEHKTERTGDDRLIVLAPDDLKRIDQLIPVGAPADRLAIGCRSLTDVWLKIRKLANVPDLRIHDLRHSFVSLGLQSGAPMAALSLALGHKSAQTTRKYSKLFDSQLDELARLVSSAASKLDAADTNGKEALK